MYCGQDCLVAFATRLLVANFGAVFPWGLFGVNRMVKCDFIQMMPSAQRSAPCLLASLNLDRRVAYGCGSAASACPFLCNLATAAPFAGSTRAISPSIVYWKIRSMQASMRMARAAVRLHWTLPERAKSASANY